MVSRILTRMAIPSTSHLLAPTPQATQVKGRRGLGSCPVLMAIGGLTLSGWPEQSPNRFFTAKKCLFEKFKVEELRKRGIVSARPGQNTNKEQLLGLRTTSGLVKTPGKNKHISSSDRFPFKPTGENKKYS